MTHFTKRKTAHTTKTKQPPRPPRSVVDPARIPQALKDSPRWLTWSWTWNEDRGKWDKPPRSARTGQVCDCTRSTAWSTFDEAVMAYEGQPRFDGVGYVTGDGAHFFVDLDGCRGPQSGEIAAWAQQIVDACSTYCEVSPSGSGLRLVLAGDCPTEWHKRSVPAAAIGRSAAIELFDAGRYMTITGNVTTDADISPVPAGLVDLLDRITGHKAAADEPAAESPQVDELPTVEQVLAKARWSNNGSKFRKLWKGDTSDYGGDQSAADQALCSRLAFWCCGSAELLDACFRQSGLMRQKWNRRHFADGRTYGQATIAKAIAGCREFYNWSKPAEPAADAKAQPILPYTPPPLEALPAAVREFVAAVAESIGCDAGFVLPPALAALSVAIGATRRLRLKPGYDVSACLWTATIAPSGAGKTPVTDLVLQPIRRREAAADQLHRQAVAEFECEAQQFEKTQQEWRRDKKSADPPTKPTKPIAQRCLVRDTTIEALAGILQENPRGVLVDRDELSAWIGGFDRYSNGRSGDGAGDWLSIYNSTLLSVDRRTAGRVLVASPFVALTGGIQPAVLRRVLGPLHLDNGLLPRFLVCQPPRRAKRWDDRGIEWSAAIGWTATIDRLFELPFAIDSGCNAAPVVLTLSREATSAWKEWFDAHHADLIDQDGHLLAALSKLEEQAGRLALVLHLARFAGGDAAADPQVVDETSLRSALQLAEWFRGEVHRLYAVFGETTESNRLRVLADWLAERFGFEPFTVRQFQRRRKSVRSADDADQQLQELVDGGFGEWVSVPKARTGPAPRTFRLLPVDRSTVDTFAPFPGENAEPVNCQPVTEPKHEAEQTFEF